MCRKTAHHVPLKIVAVSNGATYMITFANCKRNSISCCQSRQKILAGFLLKITMVYSYPNFGTLSRPDVLKCYTNERFWYATLRHIWEYEIKITIFFIDGWQTDFSKYETARRGAYGHNCARTKYHITLLTIARYNGPPRLLPPPFSSTTFTLSANLYWHLANWTQSECNVNMLAMQANHCQANTV